MSKISGTPLAKKYWFGKVPAVDDFGQPIVDRFYDAKTKLGPWAIMAPSSWVLNRIAKDGALGLGLGQEYTRQKDGRWMKTAG